MSRVSVSNFQVSVSVSAFMTSLGLGLVSKFEPGLGLGLGGYGLDYITDMKSKLTELTTYKHTLHPHSVRLAG